LGVVVEGAEALPLYVNVDNTLIRSGQHETDPVVWSADNVVLELNRDDEVPREVRVVVDLLQSNLGAGTLDWGHVKEMLRQVPRDDPDARLPAGFLDSFYERGLDFAVELLNSPNFFAWSTEFMEGQKEMTHQHLLMVPSTNLLMAASKERYDYIADEQLTCPSFYKDFRDKATEKVVMNLVAKLLAKPDSATLLTLRLALATFEFKKDEPSTEDMFKGVTFAATAAHELAKSGRCDVLLPFAVSGGFMVYLYVSFVPSASSSKAPMIRRVGEFDLKTKDGHFQLFCWLFALLGEANRRTSGLQIVSKVDVRAPNAIGESRENFSVDRKISSKKDSQKRSMDDKDEAKQSPKKGKAATLLEAMSAASLGGRVVHLFPVFSPDALISNPRSRSHYFRGTVCESRKTTFVKVISGEADDEVHFQKLAREKTDGGCRVPEVFDHCKTEDFHVIVMEIFEDYAVDRGSVRAFAASLIRAVMALHDCGILHCDLKPDNAMWDGESVAIIDFGHAQLIDGAQFYRATCGFTAPEVAVKKKPHSAASDSFSVGKTLEQVVAETGAHDDKDLAAIIAGLTKADVAERLTLSDALEKLEASSPSSKRHRSTIPEVTP